MTSRIDLGRGKLYRIGAMLAPPAVVLAVQLVGGWDGPTMTPAQPVAAPSSLPTAASPRTLSPPQRAAVEYLRTHALPEVIASPMREPAPRVESTPDPDPEPAPPEPEEISDAPNLQITAIVQSRQGAVATVGHRMLRIGDEVAPGWLITAIDASERVVRVRHADGRMAEYTTFNPRSHAH